MQIQQMIRLDMPESLKGHDQPGFESALENELMSNVSKLPLERFCWGWPDPESLEFSDLSWELRANKAKVTAHCVLAQEITTGCDSHHMVESATGELTIMLDFENQIAYLTDEAWPEAEALDVPLPLS